MQEQHSEYHELIQGLHDENNILRKERNELLYQAETDNSRIEKFQLCQPAVK